MVIRRLDDLSAGRLRAAPLTYPQPLVADAPPAGYRRLRRQRVLRTHELDGAADRLLHWQVHASAGLRVAASAERVAVGEVVVLTLGFGPEAMRAPCRVVRIVDEPDRRGFTYGTLPGHPESGEESFVLEQGADGTITFTVSAMSRPASLVARLGGPLTRIVQTAIADCYLRAAG